MAVDVFAEVEVERLHIEVAASAADPDNAPIWSEHIEAIELERIVGRQPADATAEVR